MRKWILIVIFLSLVGSVTSQKTLVVQKIGTPVRYSYHVGDFFRIRTTKENLHIKSFLWTISDSSVTIGQRAKIPLNDIGAVYREFHFPKLMTRFFLIGGAGYVILDSFNNLINNERVFEPQTLLIGSSILAASAAFIPFSQKKCRIGIRWKVKVLDRYIP